MKTSLQAIGVWSCPWATLLLFYVPQALPGANRYCAFSAFPYRQNYSSNSRYTYDLPLPLYSGGHEVSLK